MSNTENIGRNFLVTKMKCARCDSALELSYPPQNARGTDCSDGITGASKVENVIYIEPCSKCIEEPKRDLDTIRRILKDNV